MCKKLGYKMKKLGVSRYSYESPRGFVGIKRLFETTWVIYFRDPTGKPMIPTPKWNDVVRVEGFAAARKRAIAFHTTTNDRG